MATERPTPPWLLDTMPSQGDVAPHLDRVIDAVESLPRRQREVVEGLFFERLTFRQLAARMGVHSVGTVWNHWRRAQDSLRRMLEDDR